MKANSDMTIFHKGVDPLTRDEVWTSEHVKNVMWEHRKAYNVVRSGLLQADSVAVYIPMRGLGRDGLKVKVEDKLVRGLVCEQIGPGFTMRDLEAKYGSELVTVRSVDVMDYGSPHLHHWQIGAV